MQTAPEAYFVRSRIELVTTATDEKAIMAAAIEGLSMMPAPGNNAPAPGQGGGYDEKRISPGRRHL
jgi:hypothetical protein